MIIIKSFKYRIYPTIEQSERLNAWSGSLRFLWNLAHEQRLMGLARTDKVYHTAFDQIGGANRHGEAQLTALRNELPWFADVPRNVAAQLLVELDKSWQRCFKKIDKRPRFKSRGQNMLGLCEPHPKVWRITEQKNIRFPKIGIIKTKYHRPIEGKLKTCTLVRDVDQWFAIITCEVETVPMPRKKKTVAIDRGVKLVVADSGGKTVANPSFLKLGASKLAKSQRRLSKKKKGSKNRAKARQRVAKVHRKIRRQREHFLHNLSHYYAKSHGTVIIEKLNIVSMTKSASGSIEEPGQNVKQKNKLNKSILDVGWGLLSQMLKYKLEWGGGQLIEVPAEYSSQTCSKCEFVDVASRISQAEFVCTKCGHIENADINAAKVLYSRGTHGGAVCGGSAIKRPMKQKLRVAKRGTRHKNDCLGIKAPAFMPG